MKPVHILQYVFLRGFLGSLSLLPLPLASSIGGALGSFVGSLPIRINKTAQSNLKVAFPSKNILWVCQTQMTALGHLIRTAMEFPRVYKMSQKEFKKCVTITGWEHIENNPNAMVLTAHYGNWEIICKAAGLQNKKMASIYRAANNPLSDKYIVSLRAKANGFQIPKGSKGAKQLIRLAKEDNVLIGMLNDQKLNTGILAPFFGKDVMTAPALAEIARKYNRPVVPIFCTRKISGLFKLKFEMEIGTPLLLQNTDDAQSDVHANTSLFNKIIEEQIRKNPEQWLWAHRRF